MFDQDDIEKLVKNAIKACDAYDETPNDAKALDDADFALTMLRMAMGEEAFGNAHWFMAKHRQVIKALDRINKDNNGEENSI